MKKTQAIIMAAVALCAVCAMAAGCSKEAPDYANAESFEQALNAGDDLTNKTVSFTVSQVEPSSAFGYNLQAGEHLNLMSSDNPGIKQGDTATVKVTEVKSVLGSWIIKYEKQ